jgi:hypothetical protein
MTPSAAEQEQKDCQAQAGRAAKERAWTYIGCMVSKGHSVGVAFHVQGVTTHLDVTQTRPHDASAAATELDQCRRTAYAAGRAIKGARERVVGQMETTFRECLAPLGYCVEQQPEPGSKRSQGPDSPAVHTSGVRETGRVFTRVAAPGFTPMLSARTATNLGGSD